MPSAISGSRRWLVCCSRIISLLVASSALFLLQGCSAIKLAYNNAPDLAYWWIDGYADLGDAQSLQVREELARLLQWHRSNELPKIAELLKKTQQLAVAEVAPDQVCSLFAEMRTRFDAVVTQAEPAAVALAMGLRPAQVVHIEAKFVKANAEWQKDWARGGLAERQAKRLKSAVERSEQFYGTLEERQLAILRNSVVQSSFDPQLSYAERLRRQKDLLQTLRLVSGSEGKSKPAAELATAALRAYQERSVNSPNPAYRAYAEKAIVDSCKTFAQLHNSVSPEQRTRALRRLADYERDARELAGLL